VCKADCGLSLQRRIALRGACDGQLLECRFISFVMAGLVPAIHELRDRLAISVDARHKAGHDG